MLVSYITYSFFARLARSVPTGRCPTSLPSSNDGFSISDVTNDRHPPSLQGWTSQPDGRGTVDIIWTCVLTIFLCSWTVLCLNVPALGDSGFRKFRRKFYFTILSMLGPEFILMIAIGQWESARRSVRDFQLSGSPEGFEWTMTHAFFADMGGFLLEAPDEVPFPLDAKQVHYLLTKGYLEPSTVCLDKQIITDKNKSDYFARSITMVQIVWFLLSCIGRGAQHLAITTLELTTLGFIVCTFATSFYWSHKPSDVNTPIVVKTRERTHDPSGKDEGRVSLATILREAADDRARQPYFRTPLDFVSRKEWWWSLFWRYSLDLIRNVGINFGPKRRPVKRILNDIFLEMSPISMATLFAFNFVFSGINIGGWSFHFPSRIERLLWRISTVAIPASLVAFWCWQKLIWGVLPAQKPRFSRWFSAIRGSREAAHASHWFGCDQAFERAAAKIRNINPENDPNLDVPVRVIIPLLITAACYVLSRGYILLEDLIALRALPPSAYKTVDWPRYIPHW